jgi:hypothetical protein
MRYRFVWKADGLLPEVVEEAEGMTPEEALRSLGYRRGNMTADGTVRVLDHYVVVPEA